MGGGKSPDGFLLCDGSKISRKTYIDLFNVIGTRFGDGDGISTFALPNLINKFPRGCGTANDVGGSSGADTVTLNVGNLPSHSHGMNNHSHDYNGTTSNESAHETFSGTTSEMSGNDKGSISCSYEGLFNGRGTITATGNLSVSGSHNWDGGDNESSNRPSTFSIDVSHTHTYSGTCSGDHTHTYSGTTTQAQGDTTSVGEDKSFSIVPSYVNFYYIIKY